MTHDHTARRGRGTAGFSLMELLVVLGLLAVLMGLSAGAFRKTIPRSQLARNEILDKLRVARLTAVAEQAPATVTIDVPPEEEGWPSASVTAFRQVGMWHMEGESMVGFPTTVTGVGYEPERRGLIGGALRLAENGESHLSLGQAGSFESVAGVAGELSVHLNDLVARTLLSKGKGYVLTMDQDGYLALAVRVKQYDELSNPKEAFQRLETHLPVVEAGRWVEIGGSFDGTTLQIVVDDFIVEESVMPVRLELMPDVLSDLRIGSPGESFAGAVDEVRWGIFVTEIGEQLVDMEILGDARVIRFAAGGGLDPRFHDREAELGFVAPNGVESWVRVSMLGSVNWE